MDLTRRAASAFCLAAAAAPAPSRAGGREDAARIKLRLEVVSELRDEDRRFPDPRRLLPGDRYDDELRRLQWRLDQTSEGSPQRAAPKGARGGVFFVKFGYPTTPIPNDDQNKPVAGVSEAPPRRRGGFTLIELMIVVSIIAIMAAVALPKFADMIQKAQEGGTKGNLGAIRGALSIYYADNQGLYPNCPTAAASSVLSDVMVPRYLTAMNLVKVGLHPTTNSVYCDTTLVAGSVHDAQGWYYVGDQTVSTFGNIYVACDHTDTRGLLWTSY